MQTVTPRTPQALKLKFLDTLRRFGVSHGFIYKPKMHLIER